MKFVEARLLWRELCMEIGNLSVDDVEAGRCIGLLAGAGAGMLGLASLDYYLKSYVTEDLLWLAVHNSLGITPPSQQRQPPPITPTPDNVRPIR